MKAPRIIAYLEQVVVAVGFEGQRLEIPSNVNPQVAALVEACWAE